jgi:hypothetical protein
MSWISLADAPTACPWQGFDLDALLARFEPLKARSLVKALRATTRLDVQLCADRWLLRYGTPAARYIGGPPVVDPPLPPTLVQLTYGPWTLPPPLRAWYAVHESFGRAHGDSAEVDVVGALRPVGQLEVLRAGLGVMDDREGFLACTVEGTGDRLGFYRQFANKPYVDAMRWNHETREVSKVGAALAAIAKALLPTGG